MSLTFIRTRVVLRERVGWMGVSQGCGPPFPLEQNQNYPNERAANHAVDPILQTQPIRSLYKS